MGDDLSQVPLPGVCLWCGNALERVRMDAHYCSAAHKQAHYRWRKRLERLVLEASVRINKVSEYQFHPQQRDEAREFLIGLQQQVKSSLKAGSK